MQDQLNQENMEEYQSYRITLILQGNMTPSYKGVIRMLNQRRKENEKRKIQRDNGVFDADAISSPDGVR